MPKVKSFYQHYKGGLYYVEAIVTHSETQKELVIYSDIAGEKWARPIEMWHELVDGKPRFDYLYDQIEAALLFDKEVTAFKNQKHTEVQP